MKGQPLPDGDNVTRLCGFIHLNEEGWPEGSAFVHRPGEHYLSVNWLEYLNLPNRPDQIAEILRVLATKRKVAAQARLALLNVGRFRAAVRAGTIDQLGLQYLHEPETQPDDPSHSGIYNIPEHDNTAAELLAMSVEESFPTR